MADKEIYFDLLKEVSDNCYLITRGVRSCCYFRDIVGPIETYIASYKDGKILQIYSLDEKLKAIENTVKPYGLHFVAYKEKVKDKDHPRSADVWIYRYAHQGELIKMFANEESYYLKEWVIGKLLGYSDEAMEEFLTQKFPK